MKKLIKISFLFGFLVLFFAFDCFGARCKSNSSCSSTGTQCANNAAVCAGDEYYLCSNNCGNGYYSSCRCISVTQPPAGYTPGQKQRCNEGEELICDAGGGNCQCATYSGGSDTPQLCNDDCDPEYFDGQYHCRCYTPPGSPIGNCSDLDDDGICDDIDNPPGQPNGGPNPNDGCGGCIEGYHCSDGLCVAINGPGTGGNSDMCEEGCTYTGGKCFCPYPANDPSECPAECYSTVDGGCFCPPKPDNDNDGDPDDVDDDDDNDDLDDDFDPDPFDEDSDNDGVKDGDDEDPNNAFDSDNDGTPDPIDSNPNNPNDGGGDLDNNGVPNNADDDIDGDGINNENDKTPFGTGGSGGGNPGSGSGEIGGGGGGSGGGNVPQPTQQELTITDNGDEEELDPIEPNDEVLDLCEANPGCDCIPRSFVYKGPVDYSGDCCQWYYKNASNQMWCDCQSGTCQDFQNNDSDEYLRKSIQASLESMGPNLTDTQLKNSLNSLYNNLSSDQNARTNFLNAQQHERNKSLKEQLITNTEYLLDGQAYLIDQKESLDEGRHVDAKNHQTDLISQLDSNQETRHIDLKNTIKGLGETLSGETLSDDISESVGDAFSTALSDSGIIDEGATYEDDLIENLEDVDFSTLLDEKAESFSTLFTEFTDNLKESDLFTLPFGLFESLPSGGSSHMSVSIGKWGGDNDNTTDIDWADYDVVFDVLNTIMLILSAYASFKILVVKHA